MDLDPLILRNALLDGVGADGREGLELDLRLVEEGGSGAGRIAVTVHFRGITNYANVNRFFFNYRAKERKDDALDQVVEAKHTRVGWSIELADRGRVSIKTMEAPSVKQRDA